MREMTMDEIFTRRVRSAAKAGWWTLLIAFCILVLSWLLYLPIMAMKPAGMLSSMGEGVTWMEIRSIWLWALVIYKLGMGMMLFVVVWLTLWARQLAKKEN